jgi:hypothetical protein
MSKLRWAQWFWADWSNDSALNLCSIPARGLWMALLCLMAQGDPYGCVTIKGRPPNERELRKLCGDIDDGQRHGARRFRAWLAELERHGVFEWVDIVPVDAPGTRPARAISSPRMRHDGAIAMARAGAARQRWKLAETRQSSLDLHVQKRGNGAALHMQTDSFASIESEANTDAKDKGARPLRTPKDSPPNLPARGEASIISIHARKGSDDDGA